MPDKTAAPGATTVLMNAESVAALGDVARSVRYAQAPEKVTVYCRGESTDVTWEVFAVTPFGDISLGTITASTTLKKTTYSTDVAQEIKVKASNAHATVAKTSTVCIVAAK